jgi:Short C-terminal domain
MSADDAPTEGAEEATQPLEGASEDTASAAPPPSAGEAPTGPKKSTHRRRIWLNVLLGFTTLLAIVAVFSVWANRLLFNPDNWQNTSTQLLQNEDIRSATANYVVDQIYANVDVAGLLKSNLPTQLQGLAGPAAGALRNAAVKGVELALSRPRVQSLWATANRAADQAFIAVVEGGKGPVGIKQGVVTLDLASIIDNVASRLGLPSDIGQKLPASVGNLTILKSNQIKLVQNLGQLIRDLALWLTILVPLLYALTVFLAQDRRRRMLMSVGFSIVFAGLVAFLLRHLLISGVTNSLVKDESVKPAAQATVTIATAMITEIAGAFVLVGAVLAASAWFAGPQRWATAGRRALAPYLRDRPGWAFATTTIVMILVFIWNPIPATGKVAGIIVFLALALLGTEVLRRQTAVEFPDARAGELSAAMRSRWESIRGRTHRDKPDAPANGSNGESVAEQLERLSALRAQGAISDEEYDAAKASVLGSAGTPAP